MSLLESWARWSLLQRAVLAGLVLAILGGAIAAALWALRDDYEVLYSKLEPQDVATVTQRLEADRVMFRLADDGRSVTVPSGEGFRVRASLLEQGITPAGGLGFELFDNAELGLTDFAQQVNYQRALQGELGRTIGALGGVESARVHLVIPERRLFDVDSNQAKASVTVGLKEGVQFPTERVDGIRRLVASAVPRLLPENVDVHDSEGVALRGAQTEADTASMSSRLKQKQEYESYLEQKAQRALDDMLGPGRALVKMDVSINLNKVDSVKEQPLPLTGGAGVIVRSKATTTSAKKKRQLPNAQPAELMLSESLSTDQLQDDLPRGSTATGPSSQDGASTQTETMYQVGRLSERMNVAPGAITRMTGSILVPASVSAESYDTVRSLVAGIVGLQESRGDVLNVHPKLLSAPEKDAAVELEDPVEDVGAVESAGDGRKLFWGLIAGIGVLLLGLLSFSFRSRGGVQRLTESERREQTERIRRWLGEEQLS